MSIVRAILVASRLCPLSSTTHQLVEERSTTRRVRSGHRDLVALHADLDVGKGALDDAQVLVARAEQPGHEVGVGDVGRGREGLVGPSLEELIQGATSSLVRPARACAGAPPSAGRLVRR